MISSFLFRISWLMPLAPGERPDYLAATLRCLQRQSLQADELVIAADGNLPEALMRVIDTYPLPFRMHHRSSNSGIGDTLAEAAPACTGDFIVRIDSDDLYAPFHTAMVVGALQANPCLGVVGSQLLEFDTDRSCRLSARSTPTSPTSTLRWRAWRNPLNHQTVAIRRTALLASGGYRHAPAFEDWDLWLRMAASGYGMTSVPEYTAAARVNESHRRRRRGWRYSLNECRFYVRQVREGRLDCTEGLIACLSRLPWRLLPSPLLRWWMASRLRGSPALNAAWLTEALAEPEGQTIGRKEKQG